MESERDRPTQRRWAEIVCKIAAESEYEQGRGAEEQGENMASVAVLSHTAADAVGPF